MNGRYSLLPFIYCTYERSDLSYSPPKIKGVRILENPFDDIVPRITAEEKRAQQRAKEQSQREREEMERKKGAKK